MGSWSCGNDGTLVVGASEGEIENSCMAKSSCNSGIELVRSLWYVDVSINDSEFCIWDNKSGSTWDSGKDVMRSKVTPEARDPETELEWLSSGSDKQLFAGVGYNPSKGSWGEAGPSLPGDWVPDGNEYMWSIVSEKSRAKSKFGSAAGSVLLYCCSPGPGIIDGDGIGRPYGEGRCNMLLITRASRAFMWSRTFFPIRPVNSAQERISIY